MNLSPHLTHAEFTRSDTALRLGIDNTLPEGLLANAYDTAAMFERLRAHLKAPILVSSGYRCLALNTAIGSASGSDHVQALALDFRAPAFGTPLQICRDLQAHLRELGAGQMIFEHSWVHLSTRSPAMPVNAVLTLVGKGYLPGIVSA